MAQVRLEKDESFESLLRRFSKKVQQAGILPEARRREHFEKPSITRKRKEAIKKRKTRRSSGNSLSTRQSSGNSLSTRQSSGNSFSTR